MLTSEKSRADERKVLPVAGSGEPGNPKACRRATGDAGSRAIVEMPLPERRAVAVPSARRAETPRRARFSG